METKDREFDYLDEKHDKDVKEIKDKHKKDTEELDKKIDKIPHVSENLSDIDKTIIAYQLHRRTIAYRDGYPGVKEEITKKDFRVHKELVTSEEEKEEDKAYSLDNDIPDVRWVREEIEKKQDYKVESMAWKKNPGDSVFYVRPDNTHLNTPHYGYPTTKP